MDKSTENLYERPADLTVRLYSVKKHYSKFQDSLRKYCCENLANLQRLQLKPELNPKSEVTNQVISLKKNCIKTVGPHLRNLQETKIKKLGVPSELVNQLLKNNNVDVDVDSLHGYKSDFLSLYDVD